MFSARAARDGRTRERKLCLDKLGSNRWTLEAKFSLKVVEAKWKSLDTGSNTRLLRCNRTFPESGTEQRNLQDWTIIQSLNFSGCGWCRRNRTDTASNVFLRKTRFEHPALCRGGWGGRGGGSQPPSTTATCTFDDKKVTFFSIVVSLTTKRWVHRFPSRKTTFRARL